MSIGENINNVITKKIKKYKKHNNYLVSDIELLYKISAAGLLHTYLHGVSKDKHNSDKHIWFFDRNIEVKKIIDQYKKECKEA